MNKLNPDKLSVKFRPGVTSRGPIIPRRYTLTHSDKTAELFLNIGKFYAYDKITSMRDEVLGQWVKTPNGYIYSVYLHVDAETPTPYQSAIRNRIFKRELPLALQAIRYGDRLFFDIHPKLDRAPILVYFYSLVPNLNRIEKWGTFEDYKIQDF